MAKRMQQIAKKGLAFELSNRKAAETAIENEEINYRYEKGWTIGRDHSKKNILNLTAMASKKTLGSQRRFTQFNSPTGVANSHLLPGG